MSNQFEKFDELIAKELSEDETVVWRGRPTGIKIMEAPYGTIYLIRWGICLLCVIFALWFGFIYGPAQETTKSTGVMVVLFLIIVFIALQPLLDIRTIQRKCVYCVTNQRAIVSTVGTSFKMKSKYFKDIDEISTDTLSGNRGTIYIGKKLKNSPRKSRGDSLTYPNNAEDTDAEKRPLIFYSVDNFAEVMIYLPPLKN